jgi:hypothetical protein
MKQGRSMTVFGPCLFGFILLLLAGCGSEEALSGAMILGPADSEITYTLSPGFLDITASPLDFQVVGADGKTPVEGVKLRFYGGGHTEALVHRDGTPFNPEDPLFFETTTDARGLPSAEVFTVYRVPPCKADFDDDQKAGPDGTYTAHVTASVGVASKVWHLTMTVKGGAKENGCLPAT